MPKPTPLAALSELKTCAGVLYCHKGHCPEERVGARACLTYLCAALLDIDQRQPNSED